MLSPLKVPMKSSLISVVNGSVLAPSRNCTPSIQICLSLKFFKKTYWCQLVQKPSLTYVGSMVMDWLMRWALPSQQPARNRNRCCHRSRKVLIPIPAGTRRVHPKD